jgi:lipopolysaccharide/colanic/teichoic acid biosynthesis glycosyltransferase
MPITSMTQTQDESVKKSMEVVEEETSPQPAIEKPTVTLRPSNKRPDESHVNTADAAQNQLKADHQMSADLNLNFPASDKRLYYLTKRSIDVLFAASVLVLIAPVLITIAILIRLDSPGPIVFRQQRVGARLQKIDGRWQWQRTTFTIYKFRSMYHGVDAARHREYVQAFIHNDFTAMEQQNPDTSTSNVKPVFKLTNDSRITRVGKFIRASSLDELPQFFNVLKGDMTLVGPRPALPYEVAEYQPWHLRRLEAVPGLTGLWQVSARSAVDFDTMVKLDIQYVETQNLMLDFRILWQTPGVVFSRSGAK